jgi:hypothetical protein
MNKFLKVIFKGPEGQLSGFLFFSECKPGKCSYFLYFLSYFVSFTIVFGGRIGHKKFRLPHLKWRLPG